MTLAAFTIGHSNHELARFLALLAGADVTAVADVRSLPWSRRLPQYRRDPLAAALAQAGIAYVHLPELGGRPAEAGLRRADGTADYERMAGTAAFAAGLDRLERGGRRHRIALMCAERDPLDCHRTILVGRRLAERGAALTHLLADGGRQPHAGLEATLLARHAPHDLLAGPGDRTERLTRAWRAHAAERLRGSAGRAQTGRREQTGSRPAGGALKLPR